MRVKSKAFVPGLLAVAAMAIIAVAGGQTSSSTPAAPPSSRSKVLQVSTRLVTVDVVAVDSHDRPIRGLTADDFEVSDGGRQKIEKFTFIEKASSASAPNAVAIPSTTSAKGSYDNQIGAATLTAPPTVVLIDSLNTNTADLVQTRQHMLSLLKTLPTGTPIAVLLLGNSLSMVQNFTNDPSLLRAAIEKASISPSVIAAMPQDDPNSLSLAALDANDGVETEQIQLIEDFEKETYANQMDIRTTTTVDALKAIAHYLSAYQGRKNLIWVSESFPFALWPDLDFGTTMGSNYRNSFAGSRTYADQVQDAANALTTARIAVYPVDARGLDTSQVFSASSAMPTRPGSAARSINAQLRRENTARTMAQSTMDQLAETTGGKTCKNTNNLSGCVESALNDGSSYYELAYAPAGAKWDGSFRKISLKVNRSGVKLNYRRGYYAQDQQSLNDKQTPGQRLQDACRDFLPSTAIPIAARAVAPPAPGEASYEITVKPGALTVLPKGDSFEISAELASCLYDPAGKSFQITTHDLTKAMSPQEFASFQSDGLRGPANYSLAAATRVRIAVLDEATGAVGAIDIPVRKADFAGLPVSTQPLPAEPSTAQPAPAAPAPPAGLPSEKNDYSITFHLSTGQSATLDWSGDKLTYTGNIAPDEAASALFQQFYSSKGFHCSAGVLTPDDPTASAPTLKLVVTNQAGQFSAIDMKGSEPQYSGTIGIDSSARPFFDHLQSLVHCQNAP